MRVLIYEPAYMGHRLNYVRLIAEGLLEHGIRPRVVIHADAPASNEFAAHLADLAGRVDLLPTSRIDLGPVVRVTTRGDSVRFSRALVDELVGMVGQFGTEHVYLPGGDGMAQWMGMRSLVRPILPTNVEVEAILLRGRVPEQAKGIKSRLLNRLHGLAYSRFPWAGLHLISPPAYRWFQVYTPRLMDRVVISPDPIKLRPRMSKSEARRQLQLPEGGQYIGLVGVLDERKGVPHLVEAFCRKPRPAHQKLLLIGKTKPVSQEALSRHRPLIESGQIVVVDRYVSNAEFYAALSAMDVVCVPYAGTRWESSGIILDATAAGRPVLSTTRGWMGEAVRRFQLGSTVDVADADKFAEAIDQAFHAAEDYRVSPRAKQLLAFCSEENFRRSMLKRIVHRLSLSTTPPMSWGSLFADEPSAPQPASGKMVCNKECQ